MTTTLHPRTVDYVEGDSRPTYATQIKQNGSPVDLSSADEVRFYLQDGTDSLIINDTMSITNAGEGRVEYAFSSGDLAGDGVHAGEVVIVWDSGNDIRQTAPSGSKKAILYVGAAVDRNASLKSLADPDATVGQLTVDSGISMQDNDIDGLRDATGRAFLHERTLPGGETATVESNEGLVVSGDYTVNGDLTVNGSMTVTTGSLTGSGSVSGSGTIARL